MSFQSSSTDDFVTNPTNAHKHLERCYYVPCEIVQQSWRDTEDRMISYLKPNGDFPPFFNQKFQVIQPPINTNITTNLIDASSTS